jgi:hypothetical protein
MYRQGKFKNQQNLARHQSSSAGKNYAQVGILCLFVAAFMSTPFLGKKIATDDEFRARWVPSWYDYTVRKPQNPWTREELHEQMIRVQKDLRERAIRGEFTKEKLQEMQKSFEYHKFPGRGDMAKAPASNPATPEGWDRIHPGIESDSDVNEE